MFIMRRLHGSVAGARLHLLLCVPLALTAYALVTGLSLVVPSLTTLSPTQRVLNAAVPVQFKDESRPVLYPDAVFETDWSQRIKEEDIIHEAALHRGCVEHKDSVIPWTFGRESEEIHELVDKTDPQLFEKLRHCPDVDVMIPAGIRFFGYCEDAAAYTKFLESRMLPRWVFEVEFQDTTHNRTVSYHDLCPNTPILFFNHYWEGLVDAVDWPVAKPVYLMPNIEMYELDSQQYWRADVILCKTAVCSRYLRKWFKQEGNPRGTRVVYTRHTTSNLALTSRSRLSSSAIQDKNFSDVAFIHTVGTSIQKGTRQVLDCWLDQPDFPPLDLYVDQNLYDGAFKSDYGDRIGNRSNIRVHSGSLPSDQFGRVIAEGRFFLCPSIMEGYGHYLNQARSARAFIITTDVAPMNELITLSSGALIRARTGAYGEQFLGGVSPKEHALQDVPGLVAGFDGGAVCDAVRGVLENTTSEERASRADKALQQYYFDTVFFAHSMQELRDYTSAHSHLRTRRTSG